MDIVNKIRVGGVTREIQSLPSGGNNGDILVKSTVGAGWENKNTITNLEIESLFTVTE